MKVLAVNIFRGVCRSMARFTAMKASLCFWYVWYFPATQQTEAASKFSCCLFVEAGFARIIHQQMNKVGKEKG